MQALHKQLAICSYSYAVEAVTMVQLNWENKKIQALSKSLHRINYCYNHSSAKVYILLLINDYFKLHH